MNLTHDNEVVNPLPSQELMAEEARRDIARAYAAMTSAEIHGDVITVLDGAESYATATAGPETLSAYDGSVTSTDTTATPADIAGMTYAAQDIAGTPEYTKEARVQAILDAAASVLRDRERAL